MSLLTKTSRGLLASAPSTHVGYAPSSGFPDCGCFEFEWLCLGGLLLALGRLCCFYEKVVKVKADVAAILNFFSARRSRLTITTRPR